MSSREAVSQGEAREEDHAGHASYGSKHIFILLFLVCFVEGADTQLLPSSFKALEADIGLATSDLAILGMGQALAQCVSAVFWGVLLDSGCSGKWMLVSGSAGWAVLTFLLARVTHFTTMLVLRVLNGVALGALMPVSQAIIARATAPHERGAYFGWCGCFLVLGQVVCSLLTTSISNEIVFGMQGWRVAFGVVAILSLLLSATLALFMRAMRQPKRPIDAGDEINTFVDLCKTPSFMVIVLQGCFGSVPWSALSFLIMYFQYVQVPDSQAALLYSVMTLSQAAGHVLGGYIGDGLSAWSPYHGRPLTAQISVAAGIPMIVMVLWNVPSDAPNILPVAVMLCIFGLTASWCAGGVNRPILTQLVPESRMGRAVAWLTAIEGSAAACLGGPLVGYLADHVFGYKVQSSDVSEIPEPIRLQNAIALRSGMLWMTILPWTACFVIYSTLHCTLKRDTQKPKEPTESSRLM
jgi:MFS family permease